MSEPEWSQPADPAPTPTASAGATSGRKPTSFHAHVRIPRPPDTPAQTKKAA